MARHVFFSFHYKPDHFRVSQIRQIGAIQGQRLLSSNKWEEVQRQGTPAITRWINTQMRGKSCVVVLAGRRTAGRKWVDYEIAKGWSDGKGVLVVYIHKLKNSRGEQTMKGANPLASLELDGVSMNLIAKAYNPPASSSKVVYRTIAQNLGSWVEEAIQIRNRYPM
jgi:antiphage defense system Thoeris ThsB-like protein